MIVDIAIFVIRTINENFMSSWGSADFLLPNVRLFFLALKRTPAKRREIPSTNEAIIVNSMYVRRRLHNPPEAAKEIEMNRRTKMDKRVRLSMNKKKEENIFNYFNFFLQLPFSQPL
jgi:hypothetical protein